MATYKHPQAAQKEHIEPTLSNNNKGPIIGFSVGLLLLILCAIPAHGHSLSGLQADIYHSINNVSLPSAFTRGATYATEGLGAGWAIAACVLIALLLKKYRLSWRFFFTAAGTVAVFYVIKKIINEPRPIAMLHGNLHQRVVETGPGFPSGHVAAATALALTLWYVLPKNWRWVPVIWILIVAWSRIYLGVHTPADVLGGFAVGLMAVSFIRLLPMSVSRPLRLDE
ncbi:MAG TPA: phosphatase PAP2 family protein [Candidatus Saccharimonadales bacterium]|nr:phosphatase PAP2 family protein [Candidatus Saccharimonadales bacterium]